MMTTTATPLAVARKTRDPRSAAETRVQRQRDVLAAIADSVGQMRDAFSTVVLQQRVLMGALEEFVFFQTSSPDSVDPALNVMLETVAQLGSLCTGCARGFYEAVPTTVDGTGRITLADAEEEQKLLAAAVASGKTRNSGAVVVDRKSSKAVSSTPEKLLDRVQLVAKSMLNEIEEALYLFDQRDIAWGQQQHYEKKVLEIRQSLGGGGAGSLLSGGSSPMFSSKLQRNEHKLAAARNDCHELQQACIQETDKWRGTDLTDVFRPVELAMKTLCKAWGEAVSGGGGSGSSSASGGGKDASSSATSTPSTSTQGTATTGRVSTTAGRTSATTTTTPQKTTKTSHNPWNNNPSPSSPTSSSTKTTKPAFVASRYNVIQERNSAKLNTSGGASGSGAYPNNLPAAHRDKDSSCTNQSPSASPGGYPTHIGNRVEVVDRGSRFKPEKRSSEVDGPPTTIVPTEVEKTTSTSAKEAAATTEKMEEPAEKYDKVADDSVPTPTHTKGPPRSTTPPSAEVVPPPSSTTPPRPSSTTTTADHQEAVAALLRKRAPRNYIEGITPQLIQDDADATQEVTITLEAPMANRISRVIFAGHEIPLVESDAQTVTIAGQFPMDAVEVTALKELGRKRFPVSIEAAGIEHFCLRGDFELDVYTHLFFHENAGSSLIFDEERHEAERKTGTSTDAVCFCTRPVDYFEVEILELIPKGQTRTAAFGFLWELPSVKLARVGKSASELKNAVVCGGELPQIFVDGQSVKRNLEWRPRRALLENDRVGVAWDWEDCAVRVFHNGKQVCERLLDVAAYPVLKQRRVLYPLVDVAGHVRKISIVQAAKRPKVKKSSKTGDEDEDSDDSDSVQQADNVATSPGRAGTTAGSGQEPHATSPPGNGKVVGENSPGESPGSPSTLPAKKD
ncbi:unnamed protein product [Amoebophrya sp. A25]|nr:unnamed protein product [Amoebophrya sp. A25]|eukprot:GSA25T00006910001.1